MKNINIKMKNPLINSIIKNYKPIIDVNKSIEFIKGKKLSISKDKNSYSAKHKKIKNKEKEIVRIKVVINKELKSKENIKIKNNTILKNKTEQQNRKIKNIYDMGIMPTNLSKNKYSILNKNSKQKPNSSNTKNKVIKSIYSSPAEASTAVRRQARRSERHRRRHT